MEGGRRRKEGGKGLEESLALLPPRLRKQQQQSSRKRENDFTLVAARFPLEKLICDSESWMSGEVLIGSRG